MVTYINNPEWPDLKFARPRAWGTGRTGRGWNLPLPRLLVVHHTAGSEHARSAEDGAGYDQIRTDGTSAHYYIDSDSVVQCVETWNRSNTAHRNGNTLGIHYELCGTLQTRAQWLDAASRATIGNAARQMARDAAKWNIPIQKLTALQVRAGWSGICGHGDITLAFPADGGNHTDPGPHFPWDVLLADIIDFQEGNTTIMGVADETILDLCWRMDAIVAGVEQVRGGDREGEPVQLVRDVNKLKADVAALLARSPATVELTPADRAALVADFVAGITPALRAIVDEEAIGPHEITP